MVGGLAQVASQLTPAMQESLFQGMQEMAPRAIKEGGGGLALQALSSIQQGMSKNGIALAAVIGIGYLCSHRSSVRGWLQPILENTNSLQGESKKMSDTLARLERRRAEEIGRLTDLVTTLVSERDGLEVVLADQSLTNEVLRSIHRSLSEHLGDCRDRLDRLTKLLASQEGLAERFAERLSGQNQEGVALNQEMRERLDRVNEIYQQLTLLPLEQQV